MATSTGRKSAKKKAPVEKTEKTEKKIVMVEPEEKSETLENVIAFAVVILLTLGIVAYIFHWFPFTQPATAVTITNQTFPVTDGANPFLGNATAKVLIVEFADYECSACAAFQKTTFPKLKQDYIDTGKVRYVFRDFPLEQIHPYADEAALAAACAEEQNNFWEFHNALFNISANLNDLTIKALAPTLDLNVSDFDECLTSGRYLSSVRADYIDGINEGGVTAAPTFFINGHRIIGNQKYEIFQKAIDDALKAKK